MNHKVGVIGLTGQSAFFAAERLPRAGETVRCSSLFFEPGGKGHNQAIACARLGVDCVFVGAIGRDAQGAACEQALKAQGVTPLLIYKDSPTAFASITTAANGDNCVHVYAGASALLTPDDLLSAPVAEALAACNVLLVQNELDRACLDAAVRLGRRLGAKILYNPAPAQPETAELLLACWAVTPNEEEAKRMAGLAPDSPISGPELVCYLQKAGVRRAAVTLGGDGVLIADREGCTHLPPYHAGEAIDTTGAGDTFSGALAAGIAAGRSFRQAARLALVAAGISVTRYGAASSIPTRSEVRIHLERMASKP